MEPPAKRRRANTSVYVEGLPRTIGQMQLQDICRDMGKIIKIKIYKDSNGMPTGDALITLKSTEAVAAACETFNEKEIDQVRARARDTLKLC
jgi:RNA recognition motif-containing protein